MRPLAWHTLACVVGVAVGFACATVELAFVDGPRENTPVFIAPSPFIYHFSTESVLQESGDQGKSTSPYFWLSSGAELLLQGGTGATVQGALPANDSWRLLYETSNPTDTDDGYHPQNIFRLVTESGWDGFSEQADFYIARDELSASPNRNASNGLFFMSRYVDSDTLYYAGIRVDGTAVIKKKYKGTYYTLAQANIFPGTWNRDTSPNLLPHNEWITLKLTTKTNPLPAGTVTLTFQMRRQGQSTWQPLVTVTDTGSNGGGTPPITGMHYAGIRTDFMDVLFDGYTLTAL